MNIFTHIKNQQGFLAQLMANPEMVDASDPAIVYTKDYVISNPAPGVFLCLPQKSAEQAIATVISSAVHGNETAPIELCDQLLTALINEQYSGNNPLLIIFGNLAAIRNHTRFIEENMNRLFAGYHQGKTHSEAIRAATLEQFVTDFYHKYQTSTKVHLDLHTAIRDSAHQRFAIYPYQDIERSLPKLGEQLLKAADIEALLIGHKPSSTFSYFTAKQHQAISFTVELGKVKPFGDNKLEDFAGIRQLLKQLPSASVDAIESPTFCADAASIRQFCVVDEVIRHNETGFELNLAKDFANFSPLPVGFKLTNDDNDSYYIKHENAVVIFPNAEVPVGQRVGLIAVNTTS